LFETTTILSKKHWFLAQMPKTLANISINRFTEAATAAQFRVMDALGV
jgi:hypothetical protein